MNSDSFLLLVNVYVSASVLPGAVALRDVWRRRVAGVERSGWITVDLVSVLGVAALTGLGVPALRWYWTRIRPQLTTELGHGGVVRRGPGHRMASSVVGWPAALRDARATWNDVTAQVPESVEARRSHDA